MPKNRKNLKCLKKKSRNSKEKSLSGSDKQWSFLISKSKKKSLALSNVSGRKSVIKSLKLMQLSISNRVRNTRKLRS